MNLLDSIKFKSDLFNIFRADLRLCGLKIPKTGKHEEQKGENLKPEEKKKKLWVGCVCGENLNSSKTMGWLWLWWSALLLPMMIAAQQRVFLKPEEPGEVTISLVSYTSKQKHF